MAARGDRRHGVTGDAAMRRCGDAVTGGGGGGVTG